MLKLVCCPLPDLFWHPATAACPLSHHTFVILSYWGLLGFLLCLHFILFYLTYFSLPEGTDTPLKVPCRMTHPFYLPPSLSSALQCTNGTHPLARLFFFSPLVAPALFFPDKLEPNVVYHLPRNFPLFPLSAPPFTHRNETHVFRVNFGTLNRSGLDQPFSPGTVQRLRGPRSPFAWDRWGV